MRSYLRYLLALALPLALVTSVRHQPSMVENFDPAAANDEASITCLGPLPPFELPRFPNWDPNTFTLQQICAKPQYGGRARGQHIGGFCGDLDLLSVTFDASSGADRSDVLANPRLESFCRSRCYCDYWMDEEQIELGSTGNWAILDHPAALTYQIKLDVEDDYRVERGHHMGYGSDPVLSLGYPRAVQVKVEFNDQYPAEIIDAEWAYSRVSLDPANNITCAGNFPGYPPPAPFETWHYWGSLQKLCAVQLAGGHGAANAGGYCERLPDGSSVAAFTDEMTPRLDWTWSNYIFSTAIRAHCWTRCRCSDRSHHGIGGVTNVWPLLLTVDVVTKGEKGDLPNGGVEMRVRDSDGSITTTIPIVPAHSGIGLLAVGTCGPEKNNFCSEPWPSSVLGPTPTAPPGARRSRSSTSPILPAADKSPPSRPSPTANNNVNAAAQDPNAAQQCAASNDGSTCNCGGTCNSIADCSWNDFGLCKCVAAPVKKGVDGTTYLGRCMDIVSMNLWGRRKIRRDVLLGVDDDEKEEEEEDSIVLPVSISV
ncbi:MAG: hypothetical protein M1817_004678 [Caeruleum heppii]|nr:MAG: hypothetical protein M1817_004678 [Caeruleum heppii]